MSRAFEEAAKQGLDLQRPWREALEDYLRSDYFDKFRLDSSR